MLLIDGVKYEEWEISDEDELEQMVIKHAQDIFGENSIYFDKKQKLKSLAGVGSIPDGLVIMFGSVPQWHIVEVELSSHDPYAHIVPQVDKFINGIDNQNTRNKLVDTLYNVINSDELLKRETRQAIGLDKDIHKFLADLISRPPTITIIIEKDTDQLEEALRKYAQKKVKEFQTFVREGVGLSVHAHLFEPLYEPASGVQTGTQTESILEGRVIAGHRVMVGKSLDALTEYSSCADACRRLGLAVAGDSARRVLIRNGYIVKGT
jgi:hypothetical protein